MFFGWFRPLSGSFTVAPVSAIFWAQLAPSTPDDPQIQRSDSALFGKKKMGVAPLSSNQAGKGMMALLGALGRALAPKRPIKGVDGNN